MPALVHTVLWLGVATQSAVQDDLTVRSELSRIYAYLDSAFEQGRVDDALGLALPDATVRYGSNEVRFATVLGRLRQVFKAGGAIKQRTAITSLRIAGTEAWVMRRTEASVTVGGQTQSGVEHSDDTWVRTSEGWRLRLSVALGSMVNAGLTSPETAALVVKEIDRYGHPLDDVTAIGAAIGGARVVALGEATHGTHEFSYAKARIVEYLVANMGFTVLAVEGNWAEALHVNNYIKTGHGAPERALARLGWHLQSPEMRALLNAMRSINLKTPGKLSFAGFDMTSADTARERVASFVRRTAPDQLAAVEKWYRDVIVLGTRRPSSEANAKAAADSAHKVVSLIDRMRDVLVETSNDEQWRHARQAAEIVYQATAFRIQGQSPEFRDEMMARNVRWLCDQEHLNEKIIIWGHNSHISAASSLIAKPMGAWLRKELGEEYYALAFAVGGGEVRAVGEKGLASYVMSSAAPGTGDGVLGRAALPAFFLDLRRLPHSGALRAWLNEPHSFYTVGARWNQAVPAANTSVFAIGKAFDGLVYFREGHAFARK